VKRIVLLLIVVSVVMFAFVLKTPLQTIRSVFPYAEVEQTPQPKKEADSKAVKQDTRRKKRPVTSSSRPAETVSASTDPPTNADPPKRSEANQTQPPRASTRAPRGIAPGRPQTTINNPVSLYAINSPRSSVLSVLSKGTVVEPNFQIMDVYDSWTLVRVPTLNAVGFVRTSELFQDSSVNVTATQ
jgi:hypothetical protein